MIKKDSYVKFRDQNKTFDNIAIKANECESLETKIRFKFKSILF